MSFQHCLKFIIDITKIQGVYYTRSKVFDRLMNYAYYEDDYHFIIDDDDSKDPF